MTILVSIWVNGCILCSAYLGENLHIHLYIYLVLAIIVKLRTLIDTLPMKGILFANLNAVKSLLRENGFYTLFAGQLSSGQCLKTDVC